MNPANVRRVCVIHAGALGDFVLALPALVVLRARFPTAEIHLAGSPAWLPLALESLAVDRVFSLDRLSVHEGFLASFSPSHRLHRFLAGYDWILSWFGDREGCWERNLRGAFPGRVHVAPFHRHADAPGHACDFYRDTLASAGVLRGSTADLSLPVWPASRSWNRHRLRAYPEEPLDSPAAPGLCIHPGSGSRSKNWPAESFLETARTVLETWKIPVRVLLGPAESGERPLWESAACSGLTVHRDMPLNQVPDLLRRSAAYLGNDSGITHLAASLGVPTLAIFGPTDPSRWGPRGPRVRVLRDPRTVSADTRGVAASPAPSGPAALSANAVLEALRGLVRAVPGQTPCLDPGEPLGQEDAAPPGCPDPS